MDYKEGMFNPYVTCPYNKAHEVPKLRLQRHLLKCRKQYSGTAMKACPFNATHIVPEKELKIHFEVCNDRNLIEGAKYSSSTLSGELGNPSFHPQVPKEDWGLHNNTHPPNSNHQIARPVYGMEEDSDSEGALSQIKDSTPHSSLLGFGRGRIHQLVAEMNKRQF